MQQRKLNIFHAGCAQQARVPLKELKEIVFLIQPKGRLRFRHIITRQGHPRVRQPLEAVGIALLAAVGVQGRQDKAAVLFTQLGGDAVKDRPNFELVVSLGILCNVQPVQRQDISLAGDDLSDVVGVHIGLHHVRHPAHHQVTEKQLAHRLMDGFRHGTGGFITGF